MTPVFDPARTCLMDSDILLRLPQRIHPHYEVARNALKILRSRGELLVSSAQSLNEFWVVATRPATARGGLNLTPSQAAAWLELFERLFPMMPETAIYADWKRLVSNYGTCGLPAHDARQVAIMNAHGVSRILTFNGGDFARYQAGENILVVDPQKLPAQNTP